MSDYTTTPLVSEGVEDEDFNDENFEDTEEDTDIEDEDSSFDALREYDDEEENENGKGCPSFVSPSFTPSVPRPRSNGSFYETEDNPFTVGESLPASPYYKKNTTPKFQRVKKVKKPDVVVISSKTLGAIIACLVALFVFYLRFSSSNYGISSGALSSLRTMIQAPQSASSSGSTTNLGTDGLKGSSDQVLETRLYELASHVQKLSTNVNDLSKRTYTQIQESSNSIKKTMEEAERAKEKAQAEFEKQMLNQIKVSKEKLEKAIEQLRDEMQKRIVGVETEVQRQNQNQNQGARQQVSLSQVESITDYKVHEKFEQIRTELQMELDVMGQKIHDQSNYLDRKILQTIAAPVDSLRDQLSARLDGLSAEVDERFTTFNPSSLSEAQMKIVREVIETAVRQKMNERAQKQDRDVQTVVDKVLKKYQIDLWSSKTPPPEPTVSLSELSHFRRLLLDEVETLVRSQFYNDGVEETDFALSSLGASIEDYSTRRSLTSLFSSRQSDPTVILERDVTLGRCWLFDGQSGFVTIKLAKHLHPKSITLDHVPHSTALNPSSMPKRFRVFGFTAKGKDQVVLGEFEFEKDDAPIRTFELGEANYLEPISHIKLEFLTNHGSDFTCVYRVRVHGDAAYTQISEKPQHTLE